MWIVLFDRLTQDPQLKIFARIYCKSIVASLLTQLYSNAWTKHMYEEMHLFSGCAYFLLLDDWNGAKEKL